MKSSDPGALGRKNDFMAFFSGSTSIYFNINRSVLHTMDNFLNVKMNDKQ